MSVRSSDIVDIVAQACNNEDFRKVVTTGEHLQVVLMTIQPGDAIGTETHDEHDQLVLIIEGDGAVELDGEHSPLSTGDLVLIRAGVLHDVLNTGDVPLRLVTAYAPPEHADGTVHRTKAEADAAEHDD